MLTIEDLHVEFRRRGISTHAVRGLSVTLSAGRVVGVAGESGSGKSASALAAMGLHPPGTFVTGSIRYRGKELLGLKEKELRQYRGRHVSMVFQETATALNPVLRVGDQLMMAARAHFDEGKDALRKRVVAALHDVSLRDSERVLRSYPHELSGGMCQRVVIAMAISCGAQVLLADEPTTALDVSVQEEILELIRFLVAQRRLAVMMISHDLAVLAELCDDLVVMYKGEVVESGPAATVLRAPSHPYTQGLLDCLPRLHGERGALPELPQVSTSVEAGEGCRFRPRCSLAVEKCQVHPDLELLAGSAERRARCWRSAEIVAAIAGRVEADEVGGRA